MSIVQVQQAVNETVSAGATQAITVSALTIGNGAWLFLDWFGGAGNVAISSIAGGGTWVSAGAQFNDAFGDGHSTQVWVCKQITVADTTVTVTYASSVGGCKRRIVELSGTDLTTQPDVASTTNGQNLLSGGTNNITATAITPVTNGAWVIGWVATVAAGGGLTALNAGTGFIAIGPNPAPSVQGDYEFKLVPTPAATTPTFSPTAATTTSDFITWAVAVRPAASGGGAGVLAPAKSSLLSPVRGPLARNAFLQLKRGLATGLTVPIFSGAIVDPGYTQNTGVQTLATAGFFTGATSYTLSPAPDTGISINSGTGVISVNTATAALGAHGPYIVTGSNANGSANSNAFTISNNALVIVSGAAFCSLSPMPGLTL